jgi:hypothetical protein
MSKHKQGFPKIDERARQAGVAALKAQSTSNQVKAMAAALHSGRLSQEKLRGAMEDGAPGEMSKGADKLIKQNKVLSVDALLEEYHNDKGFQELAAEVGLAESYFINLAEQEIKKRLVEPEVKQRKGIGKWLRI